MLKDTSNMKVGMLMVKKIKILAVSLAICMMAGCSRTENTENTSVNTGMESDSSADSETQEYIFSSEKTTIENGLSYVGYEGGDNFVKFISNGGASSDSEVVQFIASNLLSEGESISFAKEAFGCSTIFTGTADGEYLFGRNFDWERCEAMIVHLTPEEGYKSISTVNMNFIEQGAGLLGALLSDESLTLAALYAPLDGMNEAGFAVSVNMISDGEKINQDTEKPDLTTTTAIRYLLNYATDVDEALSILQEFDMHSSMGMMVHFAMTDINGKSVVVEYIDNEMHVTETPVVTNFYLTEGDKYGIGTEQSHERFEILMNLIAAAGEAGLDEEGVRDALDSVSKDNFYDTSTTEWSVVFNLDKKEAVYYHRENYLSGYKFSID